MKSGKFSFHSKNSISDTMSSTDGDASPPLAPSTASSSAETGSVAHRDENDLETGEDAVTSPRAQEHAGDDVDGRDDLEDDDDEEEEAVLEVPWVDGELNYNWVDGSDLESLVEEYYAAGGTGVCPCCQNDSEIHDEELEQGLEQSQSQQQQEQQDGEERSVCQQQQQQQQFQQEDAHGHITTMVGRLNNERMGNPSTDGEDAVAPRYYDWKEYFPNLQKLLDNFDTIKNEMLELTGQRWTPWPEIKLYQSIDQNGDWKVTPLMHCFPAWDPERAKYIDSNCERCPETMKLLKEIPGLRTVLFSRLGPQTRLSSHQGWADLSNYVLRVHLPLVVPSTEKSCGMWVEGEIEFHREKEFLVFDDSKFHKAFNASDEERIILIFDIVRPSSIPKGKATGGHTEQLDYFIAEYQKSLGL